MLSGFHDLKFNYRLNIRLIEPQYILFDITINPTFHPAIKSAVSSS